MPTHHHNQSPHTAPAPTSAVTHSGQSLLDKGLIQRPPPALAPAQTPAVAVTGALAGGWVPAQLSAARPRVVPQLLGPQGAAAVSGAPLRPVDPVPPQRRGGGAYGNVGTVGPGSQYIP